MKKMIFSTLLIATLVASPLAHSRGGPSEASAGSILITGSVVLAMSTLPLIALDSIFGASVGKVQPVGNNMTDIEVRQKNTNKVTVFRVPDQSLTEVTVKAGQKAELIADTNGHTLQIEGRPVAYVPGKSVDGLIHSKPVK
jgi:cytochrome bd-type quinol oxidase subunit 1